MICLYKYSILSVFFSMRNGEHNNNNEMICVDNYYVKYYKE